MLIENGALELQKFMQKIMDRLRPTSKTIGVIGLQWGDEGKGKFVDLFCKFFIQIIARFNGGNNAGHTTYSNGQKHVFHILPSGMSHPKIKGVLATGMALNPASLIEEIKILEEAVQDDVISRLFISKRIAIICPWHIILDSKGKIGTTGRGIGFCYGDKYLRYGLRLSELSSQKLLEEKKAEAISHLEQMGIELNPAQQKLMDNFVPDYLNYGLFLSPCTIDTEDFLNKSLEKSEVILLEGAQGFLLDNDQGTYPFVTSSYPGVSGMSLGTGIPPDKTNTVIGVFKAYTTRVGNGPFPTKFVDKELEKEIRQIGDEYGSTTERPRDCGWIDIPSLKRAIMLNKVRNFYLAITKIDVLDSLKEIKICDYYMIDNEPLTEYPATQEEWEKIKPHYISLPGWETSTRNCKSYDALPPNAKKYIEKIEQMIHCSISIISVGPKPEDTIYR